MSTTGKVAAQDIPGKPDAQEIYLSFNFSGLVNTVITSLYYEDSVYLPIGTVFKQLRVNEQLDLKAGTITGFYIDASTPYEINFNTRIARIGSKTIKFDSSQALTGKLDYYVLPSLFKKLFDLNFAVDFNSLSLILNTDQELPVVRDYQREARRSFIMTAPQASLIQAPLTYPRHRSLLNGGILDYSLSSYYGQHQASYSYSLTGGAELLGGETEGSIIGNATPSSSQLYSSNLSWKYVFDSTRYITSAGIGNLYSNGIEQYGFRGAQISNEPVTVRTYFSKYEIDAQTSPNWDVELYLNGRLVGYQKADEDGKAQFSIPLVYGTSFIQLKYYGPSGEYQESDRRLQIPFTFVPTGELDYSVSGGKINNTDYNFAEADLTYGLADWATDKLSMDYVESPYYSKPVFLNSLSMRFSPEYTLDLDAAPYAYYRSTFNALYASQASFDLAYSRYNQNLLYNPGSRQQEFQGDFYFPITFRNGGLSFRAAGDELQYQSGQKTYSYSAYANAGVSQFNFTIGYLESILDFGAGSTERNTDYTGSILYSLFLGEGPFSFLNGSLISATARYGVLKNSLDDIQFEVSKNVQQYIRVGISAERDYVNKFTGINLQIIADLPFTRSTSSAQFQGGAGYFTENLSGAVGFDANYRRLVFNDLQWVGHSAASMRMFVDYNGDGKYEPGEQIIQDGDITLRQGVASTTAQNGVIREWNLLPYTQYSADIDLGSIKNPLWMPKQRSFSFITDPNSYKKVDIPFYVGGIVDGTVLKLGGGTQTAIPGLTMEIRSTTSDLRKTISVFNDGSFYYMGLPPGHYEAYVDSAQMEILGVYSDPAVINFEVKPTKNGDFVEGLRLNLRDKKSERSGSLIESQPVETASVPKPSQAAPVQPAANNFREGYVVQVGAFAEHQNALKAASLAQDRSGVKMNVDVNSQSNLYVVQTDTFDTKKEALKRLDIFINKLDYNDAFLVSPGDENSRYTFSVQLAVFRSLGAAADFSERVHSEFGATPSVRYKRDAQLFAVALGPYNTETEATAEVDKLKKDPGFGNAFVIISGESDVPRMYAVSLGIFQTRYSADQFADEFRHRTGLIALVDFDDRRMRFVVFTPTYQTDSEGMAALDKIRSFKGYTSAQMISLP